MFGINFDYNVYCPHCGKHIEHHSFDDMIAYRYKKDDVVIHRCEDCKKEFLVSFRDNHVIQHYDKKDLYPILF